MIEVIQEFRNQIVVALFFLAVIILAVKLGVAMRKKKNLKDGMEQK